MKFEMSINDRLFNFFRWLVIAALFGLLFVIGYWYFIPKTPIKFNYQDERSVVIIKNENKEVKSGGYLIIELDFCKYTDEIPQVSTWFVDGVLYQVADTPAVQKETGCQKLDLQLYVPKALPLGELSVKRTYHYKVNPIKTVDVVIQTEKFTIIK